MKIKGPIWSLNFEIRSLNSEHEKSRIRGEFGRFVAVLPEDTIVLPGNGTTASFGQDKWVCGAFLKLRDLIKKIKGPNQIKGPNWSLKF